MSSILGTESERDLLPVDAGRERLGTAEKSKAEAWRGTGSPC